MSLLGDHVCFGCGKHIEPEQAHIHGSPSQFLHHEPDSFDELFPDLVYCEPCTVPGGEFDLHRHKIDPPTAFAELFGEARP